MDNGEWMPVSSLERVLTPLTIDNYSHETRLTGFGPLLAVTKTYLCRPVRFGPSPPVNFFRNDRAARSLASPPAGYVRTGMSGWVGAGEAGAEEDVDGRQ